MWTLYLFQAPGGDGQAILVTDDDCMPVFFGPDFQEAITWLAAVGQTQIAIMTAAGLETFAIVKRDPAQLPPQSLARPQALLVPSHEIDLPIRDITEAREAVARYRSRRFARARRRHRPTPGPYELAPA